MNSPITGQPMELVQEKRTLEFRKEKFEVMYHYFKCKSSGEEFEDEAMGNLNLAQMYNAFRAKHKLPFVEEIKDIRSRYDLPATTMSQILGFGVNQYGLYEKGEVPSETNARIIQMAASPAEFRKLVELSDMEEKQKDKIYKKLAGFKNEDNGWRLLYEKNLGMGDPSEFNGFRKSSPEKAYQIIRFFIDRQTFLKTALNKLLFYADFYHFKRFGTGISGLQYRAIQWGPVPSKFDTLFNQAEETDIINIRYEIWDEDKEIVIIAPSSKTSFQKELFTMEELASLQAVLEKLKPLKTRQLVNMSHKESAWKENVESRSLISYTYAFDLLAF